jgi:cytochrome P450
MSMPEKPAQSRVAGAETSVDFDPLAAETLTSPHALYKDMRQRCPVAHSDRWNGFWTLTKYEDITTVLGDSKTFITSVQNVVPKVAYTGRRPPLHLDPPEHTPYRNALNPLFKPALMAEWEPRVRTYARELLAPIVARGHGDICEEFSYRLPIFVLAEFFNVPVDEANLIREVGAKFNRALQNADDETVKQQSLLLYDFARTIVARRKEKPMDIARDPTSALLAVRVAGEPLPEEMIVGTIRQLLVVGIIAPTVVIGSIVVHLAEHVDLQQKLRENPLLIPAAIEELLRLYSPYRGFARTATRDVEIRGRKIKRGEPIALLFTSANRDEDMFENPDVFDIDRPNKHLAFGRGPHQCAGAPLARVELRIALEEILAQTTGFEVSGPIQMTRWPEFGPISVPLRLTV